MILCVRYFCLCNSTMSVHSFLLLIRVENQIVCVSYVWEWKIILPGYVHPEKLWCDTLIVRACVRVCVCVVHLCVALFSTLSAYIANKRVHKNYWSDLHEHFIIKFWKSSANGSGSTKFLKNFYHCGIGEIRHILLITREVVDRFLWNFSHV